MVRKTKAVISRKNQGSYDLDGQSRKSKNLQRLQKAKEAIALVEMARKRCENAFFELKIATTLFDEASAAVSSWLADVPTPVATAASVADSQLGAVASAKDIQLDTVSHPPRRRVGRPRKSDAEKQPTTKRRKTTAIVLRYDSDSEMTRTPFVVYEPIRGPGHRPHVASIIAASKHNTDYGRKSRSVQAFGVEVPSFDERGSEFGLPDKIIEEVEETRRIGQGSI